MNDEATGNVPSISPQELHLWRAAGEAVELIDVRTPAEFHQRHADIARNVPLDSPELDAIVHSRSGNAGRPLYVICHSGDRARQACEKLISGGCGDVVAVAGGTTAWAEAGLPVIVGKTSTAVERQTRITIGSLVLLGLLLGWLVHPALAAVSAFMGVGLIYAGVSGNCGMALLLARMPWNRARQPAAAPAAAACCTHPTPQGATVVGQRSDGCCGCG